MREYVAQAEPGRVILSVRGLSGEGAHPRRADARHRRRREIRGNGLVRRLAARGVAVVLISSELPEVVAMANRTVVMHEGRVTGILARPDIDEHTIMTHATGAAKHAAAG